MFAALSTAGLPDKGYVHVVREDPKNPSLLYAGTELGLYASWDGGRGWSRLHGKNLPTVAVHDILVHPRENDLILATHGRALFILDDATPVQTIASADLEKPAHLFPIRAGVRFAQKMTRYGLGDKPFKGPNPAYGALVTYLLKEKPGKDVTFALEVTDEKGTLIRTIKKAPAEAGWNRAAWDLSHDPARVVNMSLITYSTLPAVVSGRSAIPLIDRCMPSAHWVMRRCTVSAPPVGELGDEGWSVPGWFGLTTGITGPLGLPGSGGGVLPPPWPASPSRRSRSSGRP
jgi:hypothetical protein